MILDKLLKNMRSSHEGGGINSLGKYIIFSSYCLYLVIFGLAVNPPIKILSGLYKIILDPDYLITDYIGVGGLGAAFVNAGLLGLITIFILYRLKISVTGTTISTIWLMSGFSLFGKNIFNVWFIIAGVLIYSKYQKERFAKYIYIAFLGTSLAPTVTQIMLGTNLPKSISIPLGILTGLFIGFILPPMASSLMRVHQGFSLYNIGFTSGIIGTVLVSVFRVYGMFTESRLIWTSGNNTILAILLLPMFASMVILGYILDRKSFNKWKNIFQYSGKLITDFTVLEGFPPSLINMGINGILVTLYVLLVKGDLNGPTIGGIFTIVGFSAFGKHLKNISPIFIGVFLGAILRIWSINDPVILLATLFATTLSPIAGEFGWGYGIIAGFTVVSVALNVGYLHGGFNLYNSGFAGGIVAAAMVPIIEALRKDET